MNNYLVCNRCDLKNAFDMFTEASVTGIVVLCDRLEFLYFTNREKGVTRLGNRTYHPP